MSLISDENAKVLKCTECGKRYIIISNGCPPEVCDGCEEKKRIRSVINAAKMIKDFCSKKIEGDCNNCPFAVGNLNCGLKNTGPLDWDI